MEITSATTVHKKQRRVRLGAADWAPPFGRWKFGRRTFGRLDNWAPDYWALKLGAGQLDVKKNNYEKNVEVNSIFST